MNRACSTCAPGRPDQRRCLNRLPTPVDTLTQPSSLPTSFSAIASTPPRALSQPSAQVESTPPRVLTSSASTTNLEDSLNDLGQAIATETPSGRTASTLVGFGQLVDTQSGGTAAGTTGRDRTPSSQGQDLSGEQLFAEVEDGAENFSTVEDQNDRIDIDAKLAEVYGEPIPHETEQPPDDCWYLRWERAVRLSFRRYDLPNGNVGRKFVETLRIRNEIELMADKKANSERLIVFQILVLQREALVSKTGDIRRLISRRLEMWENGLFDALLHDAEHCEKSFGNGLDKKRREQAFDHTERVFHRLMIAGKIRSAVRWVTERERGGLLKPTDVTTAINEEGQKVEMTVIEALRLKHPEPADPGVSQPAFLPYPEPPPMIDFDITGAHIMSVARWLRGGAGPGGSDSSAWQDWLLRYGAHSERLRDAVARLTRLLQTALCLGKYCGPSCLTALLPWTNVLEFDR